MISLLKEISKNKQPDTGKADLPAEKLVPGPGGHGMSFEASYLKADEPEHNKIGHTGQ
jgi:hypothetical protein